MCVTVNAGNLYREILKHIVCYKPTIMLQILICSNSSSEIHCSSHLGRCTWKQHTIGVSVHKNSTLEIPSKVFILKLSKTDVQRLLKNNNSLSSQAEYFHSDMTTIYVVYCHNWFITLTAIGIKTYICILKPCF